MVPWVYNNYINKCLICIILYSKQLEDLHIFIHLFQENYFIMKYIFTFILLSYLISPAFSEEAVTPQNNKSLTGIRLNTKETFANVKKNDMVAILIGNDEYKVESGFSTLYQCINDTRLLSRVLTVCCKVPAENINVISNCTKEQFLKRFNEIIKTLRPEQGFLLTYSGHGDKDGSLVFTDGDKLKPDELKKLLKNFNNDTVLILDACYSGNNDGPFEHDDINIEEFRNNCIRIYASLAHMTAKEISYENEYFKAIKPFYENVLELKNIDGNGYFTSFIGYFFAEFKFDSSGNISFKDLLNYTTNKGKQYTEFLAMRGARNMEVSVDYYSQSAIRLNQQPKIFPLDKKIEYTDPNHEFMVIKKYIEPVGIITELAYSPFYSLGVSQENGNDLFKNTWSHSISARLLYSPNMFRGFLIGAETGYLYTYREKDESRGQQEIFLSIVPVMGILGYKHQLEAWDKKLSLRYTAGAGAAFCTWDFKEYDIISRELYNTTDFCYELSAGMMLEIYKELFITLDVQYLSIYFTESSYLAGIRFPLGISYRF